MARPFRAVIAGVGETRIGRVPDRTAFSLAAEAARAALGDAGMEIGEVDGLLMPTTRLPGYPAPSVIFAEYLGIQPRYTTALDVGGAAGCAMVHHAAAAIEAGLASTVLCVGGQNPLSWGGSAAVQRRMSEHGPAHPDWEVPYGPTVPSLYALVAQRHMHQFGTTAEQLAAIAVACRQHASLNPNAQYREPITIADVRSSRAIADPLRVLDCSPISDGGYAIIVTSSQRGARLQKRPVRILGAGDGSTHGWISQSPDLTVSGASISGGQAFAMAGVRPEEIDVAQIYDCFTITVLVELESLGFCKHGEGGPFVEGGRITLGGALPINTHGGLLSQGHPGTPGGMGHVVEAVRQLRGECGARQVAEAELALVHGNGGITSVHSTLILGV
jgi:acetyl-CoA acetyltransferase